MLYYWLVFLSDYFWPVFAIGAFATTAHLVRRYVRAAEHRIDVNRETAELRERVTQLEETLDQLQNEIAKIQAGQEFTTKLLTDLHVSTP